MNQWMLNSPNTRSSEEINHKVLEAGVIFPIANNQWASMVKYSHNRGMSVVPNEKYELISTGLVTGWTECIDYQKRNSWIEKDYFPIFID